MVIIKCDECHDEYHIYKPQESWDINLCIQEEGKPSHDILSSKTYDILQKLIGTDLSREIFSYLWSSELMPCKSFDYGYYELSKLYLENCLREYNRIIRERHKYPSRSEMYQWVSYNSDYHEEILYTVTCVERSLHIITGYLKKFAIIALYNCHWKILQMIFDSTLKYIDEYSDWYIIYIWVELLYISIQNTSKTGDHFNIICDMVIPLLNKNIKLRRGDQHEFHLDYLATMTKNDLTEKKIKQMLFNLVYCISYHDGTKDEAYIRRISTLSNYHHF